MFGAPINVNYEPFENNIDYQLSEDDIIEVSDFNIPHNKISELRPRICEQEYKCEKLRQEIDKLPGTVSIKKNYERYINN